MKGKFLLKQYVMLLFAVSLGTPSAWAVSKQYTAPGTPATFADAAQTPTVTFTLTGLTNGAGQYSARWNKGTGSQPSLFQLACHVQLTGTNVPGGAVELYVVHWDAGGSNSDGNLGTTTASLASDKRRNLKLVGLLVVDQTSSNVTMSVNILNVYIPGQYASLALWNASGLNFNASTSVHGCALIPMPPEMQ
jgi:hypothetical protein